MHRPRTNQLFALLIGIVGAVILVIGLASCSKEKQDMTNFVFRAEIEKRMGLKFPSDAVWVGAELDRGMDYSFISCFRASKEEVNKMLAPVDSVWSDKRRSVRNRKDLSWFTPDDVKTFRSFQANYPNPHSVLNVLVDESSGLNEEWVVVYLIWFEIS